MDAHEYLNEVRHRIDGSFSPARTIFAQPLGDNRGRSPGYGDRPPAHAPTT